jgi:chorismate-pyruvate lyase
MSEETGLLYPLDMIYAQSGVPLPQVSPVAGEEVPEPYRRLLVHNRDMTPTLEAFHGERIHLRVTRWRLDGEAYWRQVVLTLDESERPVEFGAIIIYLQEFPPDARESILRGYAPLGTILADHDIEHSSRPTGFVRVISDAGMNEALGLREPAVLYGRRNVLSGHGKKLAEVVEILPPVDLEEGNS